MSIVKYFHDNVNVTFYYDSVNVGSVHIPNARVPSFQDIRCSISIPYEPESDINIAQIVHDKFMLAQKFDIGRLKGIIVNSFQFEERPELGYAVCDVEFTVDYIDRPEDVEDLMSWEINQIRNEIIDEFPDFAEEFGMKKVEPVIVKKDHFEEEDLFEV